jgi:hypothetical protein
VVILRSQEDHDARDHVVADGLGLIALWQAGMYFPEDALATLEAQQQGRTLTYEDLRPSP